MILVFDLASVLDFLYNVYWVIDSHPPPHPPPPPLKNTTLSFSSSPLLKFANCQSLSPFFGNSPYILVFREAIAL